MAKYCYLYWNNEGLLDCKVQHTKPKLCDLYEETCEHGYPLNECETVD